MYLHDRLRFVVQCVKCKIFNWINLMRKMYKRASNLTNLNLVSNFRHVF